MAYKKIERIVGYVILNFPDVGATSFPVVVSQIYKDRRALTQILEARRQHNQNDFEVIGKIIAEL